MQVITQTDVKTNVAGAVNFSISDDASKLFSMLSSALYQDKEVAVTYEIGANCYDAAPDKAFQITLPTSLDNHIRFRDFGPGLSEGDVYRLLTVYGASDKSTDNSKIGGYGIGAKSPASVTHTWNVVSHFEGAATEFLVFITETGIPAITKIRSTPTTTTGLEVVIPVIRSRFRFWEDAVKNCFKHYPIKPILVNTSYTWKDQHYLVSGNGWRMFDGITSYISYGVCAIITNRIYKFDMERLRQEFKDEPLLLSMLKERGIPLELDFNIGELQLSLSREGIQYTKMTINNIRKRLLEARTELTDKINAKLDTANNGLEYRQFLVEVEKTFFGRDAYTYDRFEAFVLSIVNGKHNIKNLREDISRYAFVVEDFDSTKMQVFYKGKMTLITSTFSCFKSRDISMRWEVQNNKPTVAVIKMNIRRMVDIKFVLNDVRGGSSRLREYSAINSGLFILSNTDVFPKEMSHMFKCNSSALPVATKKARATVNGVTVRDNDIYIIKANSFMRMPVDDVAKLGSKVAYVYFSNAKRYDSMLEYSTANRMIRAVRDYGYTVVGIKEGSKVPSNLKSLDEVKDEILAACHNTKFHEHYCLNYEFMNNYTLGQLLLKSSGISGSTFDEIGSLLSVAKKELPQFANILINAYKNVCHIYNIPQVTSPQSSQITRIFNKYPMLKCIGSFSSGNVSESEMLQYIRLVDSN